MIAVTHPLWLLGLLLIPAVWWLHRSRGHGALFPVASLLLWESTRADASASTRAQRADPAWRRRALLVSLLAVALAAPTLNIEHKQVIVWLDDGLSMMAVERNGQKRWQLGIDQVQKVAAGYPDRSFRLRTLGGNRKALPLGRPTVLTPRIDESDLPAPASLDANLEHWLLTDGTDPALTAWAAAAGIERVFVTGSSTDNVALLAIAARPNLIVPTRLDLDITIGNNGGAAATRTLAVFAGPERLMQSPLVLQAGELTNVRLDIARPETALRAILNPGDALELDDSLELPLASFRRNRVALAGTCGAALRRAIAAHPQFDISDNVAVDLRIVCGAEASCNAGVACVTLLRGNASQVLPADILWSQDAIDAGAAVALPVGLRAQAGGLRVGVNDQVLMWAGKEPQVRVTVAAPRQLVTSLDLASPAVSNQPEYALLVAALLDSALGRPQLQKVARLARDRGASRIAASRAPSRSPPTTRPAPTPAGVQLFDLTPWLLALTLGLLLWDLWASARQTRSLARFLTQP